MEVQTEESSRRPTSADHHACCESVEVPWAPPRGRGLVVSIHVKQSIRSLTHYFELRSEQSRVGWTALVLAIGSRPIADQLPERDRSTQDGG